MIVGKFFNGSGLGNMLHRYVATRVRALDLGVDYGMVYIDDGAGKEPGFKGKFFLEQPKLIEYPKDFKEWKEKKVRDISGVDISPFDPEFNFIEDNTVIEGELQSEVYFQDYEKQIDEWLKVEPIEVPDDTCVIGFRGGEFAVYPDLFLTREYWGEAIRKMKEINPKMRFEVHTDDPHTAFKNLVSLLPTDTKYIHDIGINWRSMRYAKHAIIANSSFFILPRWLRNGITYAPRYWGRRNTKVWSLPQNYYKCFKYL